MSTTTEYKLTVVKCDQCGRTVGEFVNRIVAGSLTRLDWCRHCRHMTVSEVTPDGVK